VDSHFGAKREIEVNLEGPYRRVPAARLNKFGLPEKSQYRTGDVCAVLGISSDLLRWRFLTGKYSEVRRDARGRLFTLDDLEAILAQTKNLCEQEGQRRKIKSKVLAHVRAAWR
jgi:hypothetical protein